MIPMQEGSSVSPPYHQSFVNQSNLHTHQATLILIKGSPLSNLFPSASTKRTHGMIRQRYSCVGLHRARPARFCRIRYTGISYPLANA